MIHTTRLLLMLAGTLGGTAASAQSPSRGAYFAWGTINVFVVPDTARGLRFLSAITPAGGHGGVGEKTFGDDFIPDSALRWSTRIDSLLAAPVPDTGPVILSAMVKGRRGGVLAFAVQRRARHDKLEFDLVEFQSGGRQPFRIQLTRSTAEAFAKGVHEQAPQAVWDPALPPSALGVVEVPESLAHSNVPLTMTPPQVTSGPGLTYPASLAAAGVPGAAWATFVVDTNGRTDPATVRVVYASDPEFAASVRLWLGGARFRPAQLAGRPIRAMAEMPFNFFLY